MGSKYVETKVFALFGGTTINSVTVADPARTDVIAHDRTHSPWLSILVPVYNVRPYIKECLFSVLGQISSDPGIEVILLDDASTDGSGALCERMAVGLAANVQIMQHDQNRGMSAARNAMLEVSRGEYIWFIDADDTIRTGAISSLRAIIEASRPDVILCDYVREGKAQFPTFEGPSRALTSCTETLVAGLFSRRCLQVWSRVWKRELFDTVRFPEGVWFEDIATIPRLMLKAKSFYYAAEPWIYYRTRPGSIMAQVSRTHSFNRRRNDDLAQALSGFGDELDRVIPAASPETLMAIGRFQSREFVKIAKRLVHTRQSRPSWRILRQELGRYRRLMQADSPVPFTSVARHYLRKGKIIRASALWLALSCAAREGVI